jgi:hypothetical protein
MTNNADSEIFPFLVSSLSVTTFFQKSDQANDVKKKKKIETSQVPVALAYNPSYSGGRDQEDHGSKPAWANNSERPYLKKKKITKKGWCSGLR